MSSQKSTTEAEAEVITVMDSQDLPATRPTTPTAEDEGTDLQDGLMDHVLRKINGRPSKAKQEMMEHLTETLHVASETKIRKFHEVIGDEKYFKLKAVDMNTDSKYGTPILTIDINNKLYKVWSTSIFKRALEDQKFNNVINKPNFQYMLIRIGDGNPANANKLNVIDIKY